MGDRMEEVRSNVDANKKLVFPLWFFEGFLVLMLLLSLDGLWSAETVATHSWHLKFQIALPWVFAALGGAILSQLGRKGVLNRDMAGTLIMLLAFGASAAFEVMGKVVSFK